MKPTCNINSINKREFNEVFWGSLTIIKEGTILVKKPKLATRTKISSNWLHVVSMFVQACQTENNKRIK